MAMIDMKKIWSLMFFIFLCHAVSAQSWLQGNWAGGAQLFGGNRLVQLRFSENGDAKNNSFDMPGANAVRLPIVNISLGGNTLSFIVDSPRGDFAFKGTIKDMVISGTLEGPLGVKGEMHFKKAHTANDEHLKKYVGEYLMSNGQRAFVSYSSLNALDMVTTENNPSMALTRDVKLLPQSDAEFFTARMAIAKPGALSEIVSFDLDSQQSVIGFRIKSSDKPEITATKLESSYVEEQVVIHNGLIQLGGTLLLPKGKSGLTAIHTLHGAGPKIRTNTLAMLRARLLVETLGVAILICDKRGTGHISGSEQQPTFTELASDAVAALKFLKSRPEIDPEKVGLMGVSQSGWVLPIAAQSGEANFGILVSSTPFSNEVVSTYEIERQLKANDFSQKDIADALSFTQLKWNYALTGKGWPEYEAALKKSASKKWFDLAEGPPDSKPRRWDYMRLRPYEDRTIETEIKKMQLPLLLMFGSDALDDRIPVGRSIEKWKQLFNEAHYSDYTIKEIAGTGHGLFFKASDGKSIKCEEAILELQKWMKDKGL